MAMFSALLPVVIDLELAEGVHGNQDVASQRVQPAVVLAVVAHENVLQQGCFVELAKERIVGLAILRRLIRWQHETLLDFNCRTGMQLHRHCPSRVLLNHGAELVALFRARKRPHCLAAHDHVPLGSAVPPSPVELRPALPREQE